MSARACCVCRCALSCRRCSLVLSSGRRSWWGRQLLIDGAVLLSGLKILQSVILVVAIVATAVRGRWFRWENRRRLAGMVKRIIRWEFWPAWAVYAPVIPYLVYLAFRYRSLTVFALANPGIRTGGLVGESKSEILEHLRREQDLVARHELLPGRLVAAARAGMLRSVHGARGAHVPGRVETRCRRAGQRRRDYPL